MDEDQKLRRHGLQMLGMGALGWIAGLAGCGVVPPPTLRFTRAELQQSLAGKFPRQERLLGFLDVQIAAPTLDLRSGGTGRLALRVPVKVRERLSGLAQQGFFGFSAVPVWDEPARTVRLGTVQVSELSLGEPGRPQSWLHRLGSFTAENILEGMAVYRVPDKDLNMIGRLGWHIGGLRVADDAVHVQLSDERGQPAGASRL